MGIDVWVPRIPLPGALPVALVEPEPAAADHAAAAIAEPVPASSASAEQAAAALRTLTATAVPEKAQPAAAAPEPVSKKQQAFRLQLFIAPGIGVLVSDASSDSAAAQERLASNILRALAAPDIKVDCRSTALEWPPASARAVADAMPAGEFVLASVEAALQQAGEQRLLLLGERVQSLLAPDGKPLPGLQQQGIARGPSLQAMLAEPGSKAVLWQSMQDLLR